ncbi:MAG: flagellar biosynthetic protein FliR [Syntrophorhabdaceae bacterium]|nr:flagellar biosynthetic protein FliR [Syntrophorhabdaceae bacterium]
MVPADIISGNITKFLMILLRTSVFLSVMPIIGSASLPGRFRVGIAIAFAALLTPIVDIHAGNQDVAILIFREIIFGMSLGLTFRFIFLGIEMGGQKISESMGLSIATVFNPEFGQISGISQFLAILSTLLFFAMDCHYDVIALFVRSYDLVPFGTNSDPGFLVKQGIALMGKMFVITLKVAAPIVVGMVTMNILLGFIVKATPQVNIFFIGLPLYICLGFTILLLGIPAYVVLIGGSFSEIRVEMARIIGIAGR